MSQEPLVVYPFHRRDFLKAGLSLALLGSAGALAGCSGDGDGGVATQAPAQNPSPDALWFEPPVLRSANGLLSTTLTCQMAGNVFNGLDLLTRTYNGTIGGPTLRVKPGDTLRVLLDNQLPVNPDPGMPMDINLPHHPNSTNLHTHGLHVSPTQDNVLLEIEPGQVQQYEYNIPADHPAGTFWYHPHKHGSTSVQLFGGMSGVLIVEGGIDTVPEIAAAEDLVYMVNELNIIPATGEVPAYTAPNIFQLADTHIAVNGRFQPRLQIWPGQVVRLRILNATVRQTLDWHIQDAGNTDQPFTVIAYDGINIGTPVSKTSVKIPAGGRVDVLVRLDTLGTYSVRTDLLNNATTNVVASFIDVVGPLVNMGIPATLPTPASLPPVTMGEVTEMRPLAYQVNAAGNPAPYDMPPAPGWNNFTLNGRRFDPNRVDQAIPLGAVIEWTLTNTSNVAHPHHIHIHPFFVTSNSDPSQPVNVWMDTVNIPPNGTVKCLQRFPDFPGDFVLHCHILVHEDIGMMQLVRVT